MKRSLITLAALALCACSTVPADKTAPVTHEAAQANTSATHAHSPAAQPTAHAAAQPPHMIGHSRNPADFITTMDSDGDKIVTKQEYQDYRRRHFAQVDANGDGQVTLAEYIREFDGRLGERLQFQLQKIDERTEIRFNALAGQGNSHITRERFNQSGEQAFAAFTANKLPEGKPDDPSTMDMPTNHTRRGMLALYDRNGDGQLSAGEYRAAREEQFKHTDINNDGRISHDEYAAEFQQRLDKRVSGVKARQMRQAGVRFGFMDKNKDDLLSLDEYLAVGDMIFKVMDSNRDGKLDDTDRPAPAAGKKDQASGHKGDKGKERSDS